MTPFRCRRLHHFFHRVLVFEDSTGGAPGDVRCVRDFDLPLTLWERPSLGDQKRGSPCWVLWTSALGWENMRKSQPWFVPRYTEGFLQIFSSGSGLQPWEIWTAQCRQSLPFVSVWRAWSKWDIIISRCLVTLWWTKIAMEITIFNGKIHYKWPFSIAMLVHQRVLPISPPKKRYRAGPAGYPRLWWLTVTPWMYSKPDFLCLGSDGSDFRVNVTSQESAGRLTLLRSKVMFYNPKSKSFQNRPGLEKRDIFRSCQICNMPVLSSLQPVNPSYLYKLDKYIYIYHYMYI